MCVCAPAESNPLNRVYYIELLVYIGIFCVNGWHSKHVNTRFSRCCLNQYLPRVFFLLLFRNFSLQCILFVREQITRKSLTQTFRLMDAEAVYLCGYCAVCYVTFIASISAVFFFVFLSFFAPFVANFQINFSCSPSFKRNSLTLKIVIK